MLGIPNFLKNIAAIYKVLGAVVFTFLLVLTAYYVSDISKPVKKTQSAQAQSLDTTIQGTLVVIHQDDFKNGTAKETSYIESDVNGVITSTKLNYTGTQELIPGSIITVTGTRTADSELTVSDQSITIVSTPEETETTDRSASGTKKVAIILLNWSDRPAGSIPKDATAAEALFDKVENFYKSESRSKLLLTNEVADVYGWVKTNIPYNCTTFGNSVLPNPIDSYVAGMGISSTAYSHRIVVMPMDSDCDGGAFTPLRGQEIRSPSQIFTPSVLTHEIGHNYGAKHSSNLTNCPSSSGQVDTNCNGYIEYGYWDPMGMPQFQNALPFNFSAFYKELFGWNTSVNHKQIKTSGTFDIYPLESSPSNVQTLQVCRNAGSFYSIDNRTNTGYDAQLPANAVSGALVKLNGYSSGFPLQSYPRSNTHIMGQSSLPVGATMTDTTAGIKITTLSKNATTKVASVKIEYTGTPPTTCPPSTIPAPLAKPVLLSPADGYQHQSVLGKFDWGDVIGTTNFKIEVSNTSGVVFSKNVVGSSYTIIAPSPLLKGKTYYWRVASISPDNLLNWSGKFSFRTANPPAKPVITAPLGITIVGLRPTFQWKLPTVLPNNYELWVADNSLYLTSGFLYKNFSIPGAAVKFIFPTTPVLSYHKSYWWRLRAINALGDWSAWAESTFFTPLAP